MKTRLAIFAGVILCLPPIGDLIGNSSWVDLFPLSFPGNPAEDAILFTLLILAAYTAAINYVIYFHNGSNLLKSQRNFLLAMAVAGAVLLWLVCYLNIFVSSWAFRQSTVVQEILLTLLFGVFSLALLATRALLGSLPGLLKALTWKWRFSPLYIEPLALGLAALAALGLLGGAAWPDALFWLTWLAPLLLLASLQLLWHESSIFSGLASGDLGRPVSTMLAGLVVGNIAVICYEVFGSSLNLLVHPLTAQAGFALFGLTLLQLGDIIAENWRGKRRSELYGQKKKFPIPVVTQKK